MTVTPGRMRLVEVLPDVHADLDEAARARVERLTLAVLGFERGKLDLTAAHPGVSGPVFGSVVASGLLVRNVAIGDRVSTHLYGPRDLLGLDGDDGLGSLPLGVELAALEPTRLMLLDDRFLAVAQRWPRLMSRVLRLSASQYARLSDDLAIAQLPRVEDRLLAMFWSLADRWGTRAGEEVRVRLAASHGTLGRLIGARRPTVSLGLRTLTETGRLRHEGHDWYLPVSSLEDFGPAQLPRRLPPVPSPARGRRLEPSAVLARSRALCDEIVSARARREATRAHARRLRLELSASAPARSGS